MVPPANKGEGGQEAMRGTVKEFGTQRGWGFITGDDGKDYFVHHIDIRMKGFRTVYKGDSVDFEPTETDRGGKAGNVIPIME